MRFRQLKESIEQFGNITLDSDKDKFVTICDDKLGICYDYDGDPNDDWEYCNLCYNIYYNDEYVGGIGLLDENDGSVKIQGMVIEKPYRKLHIAQQVINFLKDKYSSIYVQAIPSSIPFWEKCGFEMDEIDENNGCAWGVWER